MTKTKGSLLQNRIAYLQSLNQPEKFDRFLSQIDDEFKQLIQSNHMISAGWYPAEWVNAFLNVAKSVYGPDHPNIVFESGRYLSQKAFTGFYSIFFKIISPKYLIEKVPNIWKMSYTAGHALTVIHSDCNATIEIHDFPEATPLFAESLSGWCFGAFELYKLPNLKYTIQKSPTKTDSTIIINFQWTK